LERRNAAGEDISDRAVIRRADGSAANPDTLPRIFTRVPEFSSLTS